MKQIRLPGFVSNLVRDLRDRRLLLPAIVLLVALFAVPVLLRSHAATSAPLPSSVKGSNAGANETVPAVVAQQLGVTNYRKRLNRLQSKNPFHQQYTAAPNSAQLDATQSATATSGPSSSTTSSGAGSGSTSSTGSLPPVSTTTSSGGTSSTGSPGSSSGGSNSVAPHHHTTPGVRYYAWRVSVKVGEPGHLKERPEVQRLALLPSDSKPVVSFLGATEDGSKAVFLVSPDVDSVEGDGRCLPSHAACQYVVMEPHDKTSFHYAPNSTRYNLVLVDLHPVDVTDKLPKKPTTKGQPQQKLPLLGDG